MRYKHLNLQAAGLKFDSDHRTFEGYASAFNGVDSYGDTILPGAYKDTIANRERPIRMRFNHYGPVIGKFDEIREDEKGLFVRGSLTPGHSVAEDAYASLKHGAIDGLSIGFRVPEGGAEKNDTGGHTLSRIELVEISVVEEPADLGARISNVKEAKEDIEGIESLKEAEAYLRDACGLPRSAATALVSRVKTMLQGDPVAKQGQRDAGLGRLNWRMYRALRLKS